MDELASYIELAELTTFILLYMNWTLTEQCEAGRIDAHYTVSSMLYN